MLRTGNPEIDAKIESTLRAMAGRHGASAVARFTTMVFVKASQPTWAHPRQRPVWLYLPGLRAAPWWAKSETGRLEPMIDAFEQSASALRREVAAIDLVQDSRPYNHLSVAEEQIRGWRNIFFLKHYVRDEAALARVPGVAALLDAFEPLLLDKFELFLSVLTPGTHIPTHFGGANFKLTMHLPLLVPEGDVGMRVAAETRKWTDGRMTVFDDSFDHEAWNKTDSPRAVLLLKTYHPELTPVEVELMELLKEVNLAMYSAELRQ